MIHQFLASSAALLLSASQALVGLQVPEARMQEREGVAPASAERPKLILISQSVGRPTGMVQAGEPAMSHDGRVIVYSMAIQNSSTEVHRQIYDYDAVTGATQVLSKSSQGGMANGDCKAPTVSADGTIVAFHTTATNLIEGASSAHRKIVILDRSSGRLRGVRNAHGDIPMEADSHDPILSADGKWLAFTSSKSVGYVDQDSNESDDVFLCDLSRGTVECISLNPKGVTANGSSWACAVSGDGSRVAFLSDASDLVPNPPRGDAAAAYVYDRKAMSIQLVNFYPPSARLLSLSACGNLDVLAFGLASKSTAGADFGSVGYTRVSGGPFVDIGIQVMRAFADDLYLGSSAPSVSGNGAYVALGADFPSPPSGSVAAGVVVPSTIPVVVSTLESSSPIWMPLAAPMSVAGRCLEKQVDGSGQVLCFSWIGDPLTPDDDGRGTRLFLAHRGR